MQIDSGVLLQQRQVLPGEHVAHWVCRTQTAVALADFFEEVAGWWGGLQVGEKNRRREKEGNGTSRSSQTSSLEYYSP